LGQALGQGEVEVRSIQALEPAVRPKPTGAGGIGRIRGMGTRDQLHSEVDALSEPHVPRARIVVVDEPEAEDDVVGLPEAWKTFEDGTPQPNWVALLHEARRGRR
jgi:hypothetical protein